MFKKIRLFVRDYPWPRSACRRDANKSDKKKATWAKRRDIKNGLKVTFRIKTPSTIDSECFVVFLIVTAIPLHETREHLKRWWYI